MLPKLYVVNNIASGFFERRLHFIWAFHQLLMPRMLEIAKYYIDAMKSPSSERKEAEKTTTRGFFHNDFTKAVVFVWEMFVEGLHQILVSTQFIKTSKIIMKILLEFIGNFSVWLYSSSAYIFPAPSSFYVSITDYPVCPEFSLTVNPRTAPPLNKPSP